MIFIVYVCVVCVTFVFIMFFFLPPPRSVHWLAALDALPQNARDLHGTGLCPPDLKTIGVRSTAPDRHRPKLKKSNRPGPSPSRTSIGPGRHQPNNRYFILYMYWAGPSPAQAQDLATTPNMYEMLCPLLLCIDNIPIYNIIVIRRTPSSNIILSTYSHSILSIVHIQPVTRGHACTLQYVSAARGTYSNQ